MMHAKHQADDSGSHSSIAPEPPLAHAEEHAKSSTLQRDVVRASLMIGALVLLWALAWDRFL